MVENPTANHDAPHDGSPNRNGSANGSCDPSAISDEEKARILQIAEGLHFVVKSLADRQQCPAPDHAAIERVLKSIESKLDRCVQQVPSIQGTAVPKALPLDENTPPRWVTKATDQLRQQIADQQRAAQTALASAIDSLGNQLRESIEASLDRLLASSGDPSESAPEHLLKRLETAVFGETLACDPRLETERSELVDGVLQGDKAACAVAGVMLMFMSASPDRTVKLLESVGEAYYRWRPKRRGSTDNGLEESLARWVNERCSQLDIPTRVGLRGV
jgi:hypothetical protein